MLKSNGCYQIVFFPDTYSTVMTSKSVSIQKLKDEKLYRINTKLILFKLHFFFACGSLAAVQPFLPIFAKQIGINATAFGIGYFASPIFTFLFTPIIGLLVDFFQNIKTFIILLVCTGSIAYGSVLSLQPINFMSVDAVSIRVSRYNESETLLNVLKLFEKTCLEETLRNHTECKLTLNEKDEIMNSNERNRMINVSYNVKQIENVNMTGKDIHWVTFHVNDSFLLDSELTSSVTIQCSPSIYHCHIHDEFHNIFSTHQFWVFLVSVVFGSLASTSSSSLSSVACLEVLETNTKAYGRQRLFGTIGFGIVAPLSGLLNEHFEKSFISVICLMVIFQIINIIILCNMSLPKVHVSSNMSRDLRIIFTSKEILIFSLGVAVIGFFAAVIFVTEYLFLEDIGASRTLIGLTVLMQCLVGEVPFLFFSGWFVNKLGHFLCISCVFLGFLIRMVFYAFLKNPWLVLPVDILHGLTFGLYHGAMASFAKEKAPKGMEASLLGLFNGIYGGLGIGLGSFLGGCGIDKFGARQTFFISSILSLVCLVLFLLASRIFRRASDKKRLQPDSLEIKE